MNGLYAKLGISEDAVQRGRHARLFSSSTPWNDEERARVRAMNQAFYATFVAKAAEGRHQTEDAIERVAQGRVWTGREALAAGLVDRLGGLDVAVRAARERARIAAGQDVRLVVFPERKGILETLVERQEEEPLARVLGPRAASLLRWSRSLSESGPIARLPFELAIR
jgi:protease-4